jgi:hypothetical protein
VRRSLYAWTLHAEITSASDAVLLLRAYVVPPPSSSSVFGCVRSGTLGPLPMVGWRLVGQFYDHRAAVRSAHLAALSGVGSLRLVSVG